MSKEKGCEILAEWIKSCGNHLYWSTTTTLSGNEKVIWAKFKTFLSHIINKHSSLDDPLFNKCGHGQIHPRKWLPAGIFHIRNISLIKREILSPFVLDYACLCSSFI